MSNQAEEEEKIKLVPAVEYTGHKVVAHFIPSEKRRKTKKEYTGPVRITEFDQSIVVAYNGRTECLPADQWPKARSGDKLTLEATAMGIAGQPIHKPIRLDFHLTA